MTQDASPLLFRFHRGGLDDSMKTIVVIQSLVDLVLIISKKVENLTGIKIRHYCQDERIGWDTYIVLIEDDYTGIHPIGFLNRKPDWLLAEEE